MTMQNTNDEAALPPTPCSVSATPQTDASKRKIAGMADEWVPRYVCEELERDLAAANEQLAAGQGLA